MSKRLSVAVLGAGLIGIDMARKALRSSVLDCRLIVARDEGTPGLRHAARLGLRSSTGGVQDLVTSSPPFDLVFDASNADSHAEHARVLTPLGTKLVDLTPSNVGRMVIPTVNGADLVSHGDVSMVSCGGQASIPVLHELSRRHHLDYIEVVSTAASLSVGRSTRLNLDEYVEATQAAIRYFTGVEHVKVMINISPASPPATFRTAISALGPGLDANSVGAAVTNAVDAVRAFVPGFRVAACVVDRGRALVSVEVSSSGTEIPRYAGNLDIINSAAVHVAERYAEQRASAAVGGRA
jgi:acetaldehyde dehydrogenase